MCNTQGAEGYPEESEAAVTPKFTFEGSAPSRTTVHNVSLRHTVGLNFIHPLQVVFTHPLLVVVHLTHNNVPYQVPLPEVNECESESESESAVWDDVQVRIFYMIVQDI